MHGTSNSISTNANCGSTETCVQSRNKLRFDREVLSVSRVLFPIKPAHHVSEITGYPLRTVEYWFGGGKIPADALAMLIRSEYGVAFVAALMADAQPVWWRRVKAMFSAVDAHRLASKAKKKLREAIDETKSFDAEAAPFFHDEDFMRPQMDALRAARPGPHSPVAQSTQKVRR